MTQNQGNLSPEYQATAADNADDSRPPCHPPRRASSSAGPGGQVRSSSLPAGADASKRNPEMRMPSEARSPSSPSRMTTVSLCHRPMAEASSWRHAPRWEGARVSERRC